MNSLRCSKQQVAVVDDLHLAAVHLVLPADFLLQHPGDSDDALRRVAGVALDGASGAEIQLHIDGYTVLRICTSYHTYMYVLHI